MPAGAPSFSRRSMGARPRREIFSWSKWSSTFRLKLLCWCELLTRYLPQPGRLYLRLSVCSHSQDYSKYWTNFYENPSPLKSRLYGANEFDYWLVHCFTTKHVFSPRAAKSRPIWTKFRTDLLLYGIVLWADLGRDRRVGGSRPNQKDDVLIL